MPGLFTVLRPIYLVLGSLSLICGLVVFFAFLKSVIRPSRAAASMRPEEKQLWVFIACMSICDAILTLKFLTPALLDDLNESSNTMHCLFEALIGQFFSIAGVMWYAAVVLCLVMEIRGKGSRLVLLRIPAHVTVWGYSAFATGLVWYMGAFGSSADGTCWIKASGHGYRMTFFVPFGIAMIMGFVLFFSALCNCNALGRRLPCYSLIRSLLFVVAFIFVWIWAVVLRIYEAVLPHADPPQQLVLLHACGVSSQGFVNFLLWVSSPSLTGVLAPPAACKRFFKRSELAIPETPTHSLSVQAEMLDSRSGRGISFSTELTPRNEDFLALADDNMDFVSHNEYRHLAE